jgi:hypothetical protein
MHWDEVICRMKEKVKKHKVSLIERQVVNPDDFAKNHAALIRYHEGNTFQQERAFLSNLRGASISYVSFSNNPT